MASPAPKYIDTTKLEFQALRKLKLFAPNDPITDYVHLIAAASQYGLVFAGSAAPELKVILSQRLADKEQNKLIRTVPLPSAPSQIAVSCDGSLLAVEVLNHGTAFLSIYSVASFLSAQVHLIENIRVCPEEHVKCRQLAWNPVIPGCLAVCLANGGMSMYTLKEKGFEFHSLPKTNAVQSICWSPKGKQLVAGQLGFKLVQYKPDLSMARTIQCPIDPSWGQCSVISIQWLSTYQFAVAMVPQSGDPSPNVLIVNAPKSNQVSMVNYLDPCYSEPGPRMAQMFFVHIHDWNMLLIFSSNSPDMSVLSTAESGDAPTWIQYVPEWGMASPLSSKIQSYPIGIVLDTTGVEQFADEVRLPPRPMVHLLSNFGDLVSYTAHDDLVPNLKNFCTQPQPVQDQSGLNLFTEQSADMSAQSPVSSPVGAQKATPPPPAAVDPPKMSFPDSQPKEQEITFNFGAASTPIVQQKTTSFFGGAAAATTTNQPPSFSSGGLFGSTTPPSSQPVAPQKTQIQPQQPFMSQQTVKPASNLVFPKPIGDLPPPPAFNLPAASSAPSISTVNQPPAPTKPLISVPPKFASPTVTKSTSESNTATSSNEAEDDEIINELMRQDIQLMERDIKDSVTRWRSINVNIGTKDEMKTIMKDLSSLTDFSQQAVETSDQLMAEVRMLNLSLNEAFSTTKTANEFFAMYKNPEHTRPRDYMAQNPANRRKLMRLENALMNNEQQLNFIQRQLVSQWAEHEQVKRQYSKDRMHIPCLEGVYETLTRQKEILFRERQKINYITSKLGVRLLSSGAVDDENPQQQSKLASMTDSMLSMALNESMSNVAQKKVDAKKMNQLTAYLANRPVTVICPARPTNGMNSDVILARKEKLIKAKQAKKVEMSGQAAGMTVRTRIPVVTEIAPTKPTQVTMKEQLSQPQQVKISAPTASIPLQKSATVTNATKPISFGGFGDAAPSIGGIFANMNAAVKAPSFGSKENVSPNTMPQKTAEPTPSGFSGFGGLNLSTGSGAESKKKDEPAKPAPAFSFNIPKTTSTAPAIASKESENKLFGSVPSTATSTAAPITSIGTGASKINIPSSVTVTAIPPTTTAKPLFGSLSSGPISFGGIPTSTAPAVPTATTATGSSVNENEVLDNLKICSPNAMPTSNVDSQKSIFSSNAFGSLLGNTATTSASTASPFGALATTSVASVASPVDLKTTAAPTSIATTSATSIFAGFGSSISTATSTPAASTTSTTGVATGGSLFGGVGFGSGSAGTTSVFGSAAPTTASVAAVPTAAAAGGDGIKSLFGGLSTSSSTTPTTVAEKAPIVATSPLPKPDQSVFGQQASIAAIPASTTSTAASTFSFGNMGLGAPAATTPGGTISSPFGAPAVAQSQSPFGNAATPPATGFGGAGGSIFGGTGSAFGASPMAANGTAGGTTSIFGGGGAGATTTSPTGGGSIFGGASTGAGSSIFGGGQAAGATTSVFGGSGGGGILAKPLPFGAPATAQQSNVFGSPSNTQSGGSIFGGGGGATGSAFGAAPTNQPAGSIFGGGTATGSPQSAFSFASGGAAAAPAFGSPAQAASPFGGGQATTAFGQPQSPFGGGGGSSFGAPPAFGSPPAFGQPATFGSSPVFGGGATFGAGFASPAVAATAAPTMQNNLFAALGSSDNSLSFGNLAQSTMQQQPKPAFGGSAFSSWR